MNEHFKNVHIVGAGGVASYFLAPFLRTFKPEFVTVWDGDTLEEKNLERQNFDDNHVGKNKAESLIRSVGDDLAGKTALGCVPKFFTDSERPDEAPGLIFVFADNHPARSNVLAFVDSFYVEHGVSIPVIVGANELISSEAYVYFPDWPVGNHLDPRVRYPEIDTVKDDDPTKGCIEESEEVTQLAMSNYIAAGFSMALAWQWLAHEAEPQDEKYRAVELSMNLFGMARETYETLSNP